jgi:hypothetical protein
MAMIKQYIPHKILIPELIKNHPPINIKNFKESHLIHILNLLTEIPSERERFEDMNGFIPINAKKLQGRIHNYKEYIEYLIGAGIIESDGYYIPELKSKGYRISPDFICEVVTIGIKDVFLERKIRKDREIKSSVKQNYGYLIKWWENPLQIEY